MKKTPGQFGKFAKKKSNAAIKEQFKQEKRKWKKEREEFFDKKRKQSGARSQESGVGSPSAAKGLPQARQESGIKQPTIPKPHTPAIMPLNKFIAHCGICSRRDAAEMVKLGKVKVNGQPVTEPGFKVSIKDEVIVNGKKVQLEKNLVYILLNKPKDFITTTDDPQGRKTVLDLIRRATTERVYPVGRLDR